MIVLIAQVTGVADITALIAIFGVNASMILFGWLQEKYETPGNGGWLPFIFGCITGIVPWIALLFYVFSIGGPGDTSAPAFVYFIVLTIFLFFNSFALVQWLQYKKVGKWSDYLRGERTYITLSLATYVKLSLLPRFTPFGAVLHAFPIASPFFSPFEFSPAMRTDFWWESVLSLRLHMPTFTLVFIRHKDT